MAWTAPRTWVAGEVLTAALLNTHVRDNLLELSTHVHDGAAGEGASTISATAISTNITAQAGIRIGVDSGDNEIDDATQGAASTTLYIGNASINVTSDARVKSNIRPWDGPSIIDQLEVVEFDQHSNRPFGDVEHYVGLTAQNIYKVAPWAVNTQGGKDCLDCLSADKCGKHRPWHVNYGLLCGVLVWEIHQLKAAMRSLDKGGPNTGSPIATD